MDDNTKAQCVVCLKDGGYGVNTGAQVHEFFEPLTAGGLPYLDRHGKVRTWERAPLLCARPRVGLGTAASPVALRARVCDVVSCATAGVRAVQPGAAHLPGQRCRGWLRGRWHGGAGMHRAGRLGV
jgi:hypothetical protein